MHWINSYPSAGSTAIYIGDGQEPYYTEDTEDRDAALHDFMATYDCGENDAPFTLTLEQWVEGEIIASEHLEVESTGERYGLRCCA